MPLIPALRERDKGGGVRREEKKGGEVQSERERERERERE
jgi:hypothetical protein